MKCCEKCGQTLPPDHPKGLRLSGMLKLIFDRVRKAGTQGVRTDVLFDLLYNNRSDGGPETGYKIIAVRIWHLNKRLKPFGLKIHCGQSGAGVLGHYFLLKLP